MIDVDGVFSYTQYVVVASSGNARSCVSSSAALRWKGGKCENAEAPN